MQFYRLLLGLLLVSGCSRSTSHNVIYVPVTPADADPAKIAQTKQDWDWIVQHNKFQEVKDQVCSNAPENIAKTLPNNPDSSRVNELRKFVLPYCPTN